MQIESSCSLTCDFRELLDNLLFCFTLGDGAHKQPIVGHRDANPDVFTGPDFIVVALEEKRRETMR